jgi:Na+/H+-dicarboxylate symporter
MMQRRRGGAETMMNLLPLFLGIVLLVFGIASESWRNVLIGVALVGTVLVGYVGPRLAPPAPGISAEQARARRAAAIILPSGIIYLALGILLRTAIPASERGGSTLPIAIFAVVMGILSVLSGLGALVRSRHADAAPDTVRDAALADGEQRGDA